MKTYKMKNKLLAIICLFVMVSCKAQYVKDWESFLSRFPERTIYSLDSLDFFFKKYHGTNDTISPRLINKVIWNKPDKKTKSDIDIDFVLIDKLDYSPIFGIPYDGDPTYPIAKINTEFGFVLIYLVESEYFRSEGYGFNLHTFNEDKKHISGLAFDYAPPQEQVTDLVYPEVIDENHFLVTNILAESLINPGMNIEKWLVEIRGDGMLHVVWMVSEWSTQVEGSIPVDDGYLEVRSIYDFYIEDPDGYTNLREEPTTKSEVLEEIPEKQKLTIVDISKNWWKVITNKGNIGYVHRSRIAMKKK
ncbi:MAG: SH3 domain-containing protein [Allomuricauda sp.]